MSRALYNVAQNTATPISVTNVAMSDPNGVRPRQSRHTAMEGFRLEILISPDFRDESAVVDPGFHRGGGGTI